MDDFEDFLDIRASLETDDLDASCEDLEDCLDKVLRASILEDFEGRRLILPSSFIDDLDACCVSLDWTEEVINSLVAC